MPAIKTQSKKVTFERLHRVSVGAISANILAQTTADRLDNGVSEEICYAIITSPLTTAGVGEALEFVEPYIDGKSYDGGNQLQVRGDLDASQMPPQELFTAEKVLGPEGTGTRRSALIYGLGLPDLAVMAMDSGQGKDARGKGLGNNILRNTTVKVKAGGTIAAQYKCGNSATTDNSIIEFWGYKYHSESALTEYMARVYGRSHQISMFDKNAMRQYNLTYDPVPAIVENWPKLIGGQDQGGKPGSQLIIKKLIRWTRNAKATTVNQRYDLDFESGNVDNEYNDMKFEPKDDKLIIIAKLGILAGSNHQQTFIKVNGEDILNAYTSPNYNALIFGRDGETATALEVYNHRFRGMPSINPVYIHGETGKVQFLDDGTAISDGTNFAAGSLVCLEALEITSDALKNQ